MTNADHIRQMTDEQIAQFLNSIVTHCREESCDDNCPLADCCACDCDWQERWLKQEAKDDEKP